MRNNFFMQNVYSNASYGDYHTFVLSFFAKQRQYKCHYERSVSKDRPTWRQRNYISACCLDHIQSCLQEIGPTSSLENLGPGLPNCDSKHSRPIFPAHLPIKALIQTYLFCLQIHCAFHLQPVVGCCRSSLLVSSFEKKIPVLHSPRHGPLFPGMKVYHY